MKSRNISDVFFDSFFRYKMLILTFLESFGNFQSSVRFFNRKFGKSACCFVFIVINLSLMKRLDRSRISFRELLRVDVIINKWSQLSTSYSNWLFHDKSDNSFFARRSWIRSTILIERFIHESSSSSIDNGVKIWEII